MTTTVISGSLDVFGMEFLAGDILRFTETAMANVYFINARGGVKVVHAGDLQTSMGFVLYADLETVAPNQVRIQATGVVEARNTAVVASGSFDLVNLGRISTGDNSVQIGITSAYSAVCSITNGGLISTTGANAIVFSATDNVLQTITVNLNNTGTIQGDIYQMRGNADWTIINAGLIEGDILLLGQDDRLINRGAIVGTIDMGDGNDRVDNRNATGAIHYSLGAGDDLALLGKAAEQITGGDGVDVVSYAHSLTRIVLNLTDAALNRGMALGDTFAGVETFRGSDVGDDRMIGDAAANRFEGLRGADTLIGGAGDDVLAGGQGADLLFGGLDADQFLFDAPGKADKIQDFAAAESDLIVVSAAGFGLSDAAPGAVTAAQFAARAGHVAATADERFIYDTTTRTLWVDADGLGGADAVLIAQVQRGVLLTAGDLLIA